jgi:LPXTG-site transpeptidase (sortase) family protein
LFIISILIISTIFISNIYTDKYHEEELINEYIEDTKTTIIDTTTSNTTVTSKLIKTTHKNNYLMILDIPVINVKRGIYNIDDPKNNVDNNITILKQSNMPDIDKGNVILASHNGNSKVSYFKYLEKLNIGDKAYIYYQGIKYVYEVYKIDIVDKVGTIKINKDSGESNLILISCKNGTKDKQIVYLLKCVSKINY